MLRIVNRTEAGVPYGSTERVPLFIGRREELHRLEEVLQEVETRGPEAVTLRLHVEGMPGSGKSYLLAELRRRAEARGWLTLQVDARDAAGHGESLAAAILAVLPADPEGAAPDPWAVLPSYAALCQDRLASAAAGVPVLLVVDAYETAGDAQRWLLETLVPQLPPAVLLVTAGRKGPGLAPGVCAAEPAAVEVLTLGDFSRGEVEAYAAAAGREIAADDSQRLWSLTQGHPLTLSCLVMAGEAGADLAGDTGLDAASELRTYLLGRWLGEEKEEGLRPLLDAAALLPSFEQELLAGLLEESVASADFDRLCALSFVRPAAEGGWAVHPVLRRLLASELRRSRPALHERLAKRSVQLLDANPYGLTAREEEVARMVLDCRTTAEIAQTLIVAEITVKKHLSHIFEKTGVRNRKELIKKLMGS
ncbi:MULTISPECIES: helix-turn-helix transcriptional regulator [Paenibacillus]|uniref:helix-turn-helix transcriptional regulator n=1 Tax=Paenibacillus TaxID=44249 RepID=UPI0022B87CB7|nr:AAA family ATPase [Paenibacillus caseinilyticus]MCZ8518976.1 AAA family ATPase [Paenibacillus caseinilyticus]